MVNGIFFLITHLKRAAISPYFASSSPPEQAKITWHEAEMCPLQLFFLFNIFIKPA